MKVLGINALYHDPAAALVVDGQVVAAAEEERFSRRKHGKRPLPWSAWELPELSAAWVLAEAGLTPADLDAVAYSFDPRLMPSPEETGLHDQGDVMRKTYAEQAPSFLAHYLPGLSEELVRFVPHHVAHAASAGLAAPYPTNSVLVLDGRGEAVSHLAGRYTDGQLEVLASQALPHSLGLLYEDLTEHLGFLRSSDEYKVMAMASYGKPRFAAELEDAVRATGDGGFRTAKVDFAEFAPRLRPGRRVDRGARRPRRQRPAAAGGDAARPGALAARAHRRPRPHPGRRRGPQLRGQQPDPRRGPVRARLGAAGRRRLRHGTGRGAVRRARPGRPDRADARRGPRPRLDRRGDRGVADHRRDRLRAARTTSPTPSRRCWRTTGSSPGSRAAASSARARWATGRCWPTRATRRTSSG